MQVLIKEHPDLVLIRVTHLLRRDGNHIAVFIATLYSKFINVLSIREQVVKNAQFRQFVNRDLMTRVVGFTLIALQCCQLYVESVSL
jgi:hypothetical protein